MSLRLLEDATNELEAYKPAIYVLHFASSFYIGSTRCLRQRLQKHTAMHGSAGLRLRQAYARQGLPDRIEAKLFTTIEQAKLEEAKLLALYGLSKACLNGKQTFTSQARCEHIVKQVLDLLKYAEQLMPNTDAYIWSANLIALEKQARCELIRWPISRLIKLQQALQEAKK